MFIARRALTSDASLPLLSTPARTAHYGSCKRYVRCHAQTLFTYSFSQAVERFALSDAQFNTAQKPRRAWQGERDESANRRYLLNIRMFFQKGKGGAPPLPYEPHPLVQKALEDNPTWYANPERPKPFSMEGKKLVDLKDATEPTFRRGDVVWMTFSVQLILGAKAWWTELVPKCFVRVGRVPMDTSTLDATLSVPPTTISVFSVGNFEFSDDGTSMCAVRSESFTDHSRSGRGRRGHHRR